MTTRIGAMLLGLLALFSCVLIFLGFYRGPAVEISTVGVSSGFEGAQLAARGTVVPEFEYELRAKTEGYLEQFTKREGDRTRRGELLARIRSANEDEYSLQIAQLVSSLEKEKAQRRIAAENHNRFKRGLEQGVIPASQVLEARQQLQLADVTVNSIQRELDSVRVLQRERDRLISQNRDLEALYDGVLTEKHVANGEWVEKGMLIGKVVSVDRLQIKSQLLPDDATSIRPGMLVEVSVQEHKARWQEEVLQVSPVIRKTAENSHLQEVVISSRNAPFKLTVNTKTNLAFRSQQSVVAQSLPLDAVTKAQGAYRVLRIDREHRPGTDAVFAERGFLAALRHMACGVAQCDARYVRLESVAVETGVSNLDQVEILRGVGRGDEVVIPDGVTRRYRIVVADSL